jgi:FixJ family two-component response regulator
LSRSKPLIAVVDDDESVNRAFDRLLHSLGMDTQTFGSGTEFLWFLEATPSFHPDCVVLDLHMPGLNGLDVQERLSERSDAPSVIVITAYDETATRERALQGGAVAFLRKPVSEQVLMRTLDEALRRKSER